MPLNRDEEETIDNAITPYRLDYISSSTNH